MTLFIVEQATGVRLIWNSLGTAVLALTSSEVDSSNKSYYGEQKLHYLSADGTLDCLVPLPKVRSASYSAKPMHGDSVLLDGKSARTILQIDLHE